MDKINFKDFDKIRKLDNKIAALERKKNKKLKKVAAYRQQIQENPNALYTNYHTDKEFHHIKVPHCPTCDKSLTRRSRIVNDIVWDTVNYCQNCGQMLKWDFYNDNV